MENNTSFLSRGKGKIKGDVKRQEFFNLYKKQSLKPLDSKTYNAFLKDLISSYTTAIVQENMSLRLIKIGSIRVGTAKLSPFKKDGTLRNNLKVDWVKTWEYWKTKYVGLTEDEIAKMPNKKVLYFLTTKNSNVFYKFVWERQGCSMKYVNLYTFTPSRQYARMIAKEVNKVPRTTFYYNV